QRANIITDPNAILMRPSAAHNPVSDKSGLSQSPAPEQRQRNNPSIKHIGPNATAIGKKCSPTIKRLANRAKRSPRLRYLGKAKRNTTIPNAKDPNKEQSGSRVGFPNGAIRRPAKKTRATAATTKAQMSKKSRLFGNSAPATMPRPTMAINRPPAGAIGKSGAHDSG